ncbi:amidohydrolase family protein [Nannocystis sp. ncelm1]|uniref:Amidohydrolase family protein n=2 Tax=Nannocystis radixulma TaxID=2995305 RepID=A0ABT5AY47_9BACT|nr:amidohydrolase family protein [Nannocystis radixulma]
MRLHTKLGPVLASVFLVTACARAQPVVPPPRPLPAPERDFAPFADHHAHLFSLAVATHRIRPPLPPVALPDDLARLLRQRELLPGGREAFRNRLSLAGIYADDAVVIHRDFDNWVQGPIVASLQASLHETLGFGGSTPHLSPVAFERGASVGFVAGYISRGEPGVERHIGEFHLSLSRGRDGNWRIAAESLHLTAPARPEAAPAEALIAELDAAGVQKALVPSSAYWWGSSILPPVDDEYVRVREENDWVAAEVARFPARLVGFCSFNPLKSYALDEIARCAKIPGFRGIKLHIADANVDLKNPAHVEQLQRVFQSANQHRLAIAAHIANQDLDFGREHAAIYLDKILPTAPDVAIQIMHLAGHGPAHGGEALAAFAEAIEAGDPRLRNVYFDVASNVMAFMPPELLEPIARRLRQIGTERILFGTDRPAGGPNFTARTAWQQFRRLPLTEDEFRAIADNVAPYMR